MSKFIFSTFQRFFSKLVVCSMLFAIGMFGTAMITGTVTSLRELDASLGLLKKNKAPGYDLVDKKVMDMVLERKPIKVKALDIISDTASTVGEGVIEEGGNIAFGFIENLLPNCFSFSGFSTCRNATEGGTGKAVAAETRKDIAPENAKALNSVLSGHFNNIVSSITRKVTGKLMSAMTKDVMTILKGALSYFDKYTKLLEGLADNYSGTRVAIGFLIYKRIEGVNGRGSSNFLSSDSFVKQQLAEAIQSNSFPEKTALLRVITDGVAWLDFMNVQRFSQTDIINDVYNTQLIDKNTAQNATALKGYGNVFTEDSFFAQMENSIDKALVGVKCENSNIISGVPILGNLLRGTIGGGNPCQLENASSVKQALKARQAEIEIFTQRNINQYQFKSPADCKARGYFEVIKPGSKSTENPKGIPLDKFEIGYEQSNPGTLGRSLAIAADQILPIEIGPDECQTLNTIAQRRQEYLTGQVNSSNLKDVGGDNKVSIVNKLFGSFGKVGTNVGVPTVQTTKDAAGQAADKDIFQNFLNTSVGVFNDFSKSLTTQFDKRFSTLLAIGNKIGSGGESSSKLINSIEDIKNRIGKEVKDNIDNLSTNFKSFKEKVGSVKENNGQFITQLGNLINQ